MKSQALSQEQLKKHVAVLESIKPGQQKLTSEQKKHRALGFKHYGVHTRVK